MDIFGEYYVTCHTFVFWYLLTTNFFKCTDVLGNNEVEKDLDIYIRTFIE